MLQNLTEIKKQRKYLGLTQQRFAELVGISQSLLAKIESGHANPGYAKVTAIFNKLEDLGRVRGEENVTAREIMHTKPKWFKPDDLCIDALDYAGATSITQFPVVNEQGKIFGSIRMSILQNLNKRDKIKKGMEEPFPTVDGNLSVNTVAKLLESRQAVIVIEGGEMRGIITQDDLAKLRKLQERKRKAAIKAIARQENLSLEAAAKVYATKRMMLEP